MKWRFTLLLASSCVVFTLALPASLVEDVAANEPKDKKVKRAHDELLINQENVRSSPLNYENPTAIKRGGIPLSSDWDHEDRSKEANLADLASALYSTSIGNNLYDGKSIIDYEKGYRYGANKENLDEALENAVLKSELYGEPGLINQYRYFDERPLERKRRGAQKIKKLNYGFGKRSKRDIELTPEEVLALLALWENDRKSSGEFRPIWSRYEPNSNLGDDNDNDIAQDENWLDSSAYPHATYKNDDYYVDKRRGLDPSDYNKKKRFMVARKRNDPTRELRYFNGPAQKNEYYTLSQLLASQREPDVPLYHRMVL